MCTLISRGDLSSEQHAPRPRSPVDDAVEEQDRKEQEGNNSVKLEVKEKPVVLEIPLYSTLNFCLGHSLGAEQSVTDWE